MKKLIYLSFLAIAIISVSCNKNHEVTERRTDSVVKYQPTYSKKEITSIVHSINSGEKVGPGWLEKVKKWFNDHTGTYLFSGCTNHNPCGPCAGLCLRAGLVTGDENNGDSATPEDYANGLRVFGLSLIENTESGEQAIMFVFNSDVNDFTTNGAFYIEKDLFVSNTIANAMGKNSIKFVKGNYSVVFDASTGYSYALVQSVIN